MTGYEFEEVCAQTLKRKGYKHIEITKASVDQGVDIIATKKGIRYAIQCKYYSYPVGNKSVQEVVAGMKIYDCEKAIVMTNTRFTKAAIELAQANEVELWPEVSEGVRMPIGWVVFAILLFGGLAIYLTWFR